MFACLYSPGNVLLLLECARHFSPLIEVTSKSAVILDLLGLNALFGAPQEIATALERRIGIAANIAVAGNPDAAFFAAKGLRGITVIPPGKEADVLAPLGVHLLECPGDVASQLDMWGVRTFGQLAALPPIGVAARLGQGGVDLLYLAQGAAQRQLRHWEEARAIERTVELEYPIPNLEPLSFVLSAVLTELCQELAGRSLATNELRLDLALENGDNYDVLLRLPVPILEKSALLKLLQLHLGERPPDAPIVRVRVRVEAVRPQTLQHSLFEPAYPAADKTEVTIARIRHFVGPEKIGSPRVLDTHRPDSFRMDSFVANGRVLVGETIVPARMALRRLRPPHGARVHLLKERPVHITSTRAQGEIAVAKGPWITSGHWWRKDVWNRHEWDIALRSREIFRIFEDQDTHRWFVEGSYD